ncbi:MULTISPECIES: response regulator transcription factor [Curtobacterium]|uniref:response regulator n=1 Tax=Curtobacterium TaxID=2034 RepID=UPI000F4706A1|nr:MULTISPECIES: response regulator transcription factor [Curtobacterium]NQW89180.1 response regulator transcription factor [Curtobacterium sp. VKM Ac-2861]MBT1622258.1 response regulator transcription factor [Curtobacterium flaccumfaciens pv. oortii]ROQ07704.1 DNA-binding NarL/FixJ family response regulator [Curtobacterium sp. PhB171]ROQ23685.1 DNA-binding NarL/FixJ family response regulator [Curtobacterium sp. PhB170]ROS35599.1 DNA-binding NarL/FixJ family response regulator [Curtobacterium 
MTRVMVVDDQQMFRMGLRAILQAQDDVEVVGEAANGAEAVVAAIRLQPDVILMDVRMPELDGIEATRRITAAPTDRPVRVVMLTTFDIDDYVFDALRAGASGFLLKDASADELVAAVRTVAAGEALLAPRVTRHLVEAFVAGPVTAAPRTEVLDVLTDRERDVFLLMARGRSNGEIAGDLFIAEQTVKTHVGRVLAKLQLRDRVHAVVLAYEAGLVRPSA